VTAVARTRKELAAGRAQLSGRVGVVMTMGALHDGHAELVRHAAKSAESVVVTIFVNPLQFGDPKDLRRYPRTFDADLALCEELGVDLVFAPSVEEMYPCGTPQVTVCSGELGGRLEGAARPGHFDGVLTVVSKLMHLTRPDVAVFGEKDAQQLALIRRMVSDLDMAVEIIGVPTVREADGLARSSRNTLLSDAERKPALALSRALAVGAAHARKGADAVLAAAREELARAEGVEPSYLELIDDATWEPPTGDTRKGRLLVAAVVGGVRLIDNEPIYFKPRAA
jgi:pantoate--beta-alanine ligase